MAKLILLIDDESLESNTSRLTFYKCLLADFKKNQLKGRPNMPTKTSFFVS